MQVKPPVEDHTPAVDAKRALVLFEVNDSLGQDVSEHTSLLRKQPRYKRTRFRGAKAFNHFPNFAQDTRSSPSRTHGKNARAR